MSRASKVVPVILIVLLVAVLAAALYLWITVRRPFPKTDGVITLDGLQAEVNVYRDEHGVPHIYAQNMDDLYFAQGYIHAQDRFWQMEFWRHVGQGRLAEIVGQDLVETDTFIRTVGWNRMAQTHLAYYEREAPEMMAVLEAYSAGVNAYLAQQGDNVSLNRTVLGLVQEPWEIEPWEPLDTVSWGVVMAWDLGGNWDDELTRARLTEELLAIWRQFGPTALWVTHNIHEAIRLSNRIVVMTPRPGGRPRIVEMSRSPKIVCVSDRGIGVAVITITCGDEPSLLPRSAAR